ncbi:hypothetical protein PR048_003957 [Dryococelus australis]|uniref:Uncharacterized protein n=1 Tax=Dryococelus australis TaxID=614101 RepID=A0ABQ9I5A5_9NEOP|nr:hypothetical protein PR048_003957 [Dryococelus australis]
MFSVTQIAKKSVTNAECLFTYRILEHDLPISCTNHAGSLLKNRYLSRHCSKVLYFHCALMVAMTVMPDLSSCSNILHCCRAQSKRKGNFFLC